MPVYSAGKAIVLYPGDQGLAFGTIAPYATTTTGEAQSVAATGASSQAFVLSPSDGAINLSLSLIFSANPGTFNYQVQDADIDADANYVTLQTGTITGPAVNQSGGTFVWRAEFIGVMRGNFVRLKVNTQTQNVVTVIAVFNLQPTR